MEEEGAQAEEDDEDSDGELLDDEHEGVTTDAQHELTSAATEGRGSGSGWEREDA